MVTVHVSGRLKPQDKKFLAHHGDEYIKKLPEVLQHVRGAHEIGQQVILEIGFGNGQHLLSLAQRNTNGLVIGVELYFVGLVLAAKKLFSHNITNTTLTKSDARDVLDGLPAGILSQCYILFPDPWRKTKHNKRRLIKKEFLSHVMKKISPGGVCYIATDWQDYAEEIDVLVAVYNHHNYHIACNHTVPEILEIQDIMQTSFAQRSRREGRDVWVFVVTK
jgi:tRNA (guanine-N7-)-methyltransferase